MNDLCDGCQRPEVHKKCPAHGTPFYMSGIPYTKEVHATRVFGGGNIEDIFAVVKSVLDNLGVKYKDPLSNRMVQYNQDIGLYE